MTALLVGGDCESSAGGAETCLWKRVKVHLLARKAGDSCSERRDGDGDVGMKRAHVVGAEEMRKIERRRDSALCMFDVS